MYDKSVETEVSTVSSTTCSTAHSFSLAWPDRCISVFVLVEAGPGSPEPKVVSCLCTRIIYVVSQEGVI